MCKKCHFLARGAHLFDLANHGADIAHTHLYDVIVPKLTVGVWVEGLVRAGASRASHVDYPHVVAIHVELRNLAQLRWVAI
mmetsp:Transcript_2350/g.3221  ORF Transcript_2350/g.3221 Transcript_2350/m.3221 type:complete len:81 (+) Transcript_2350:855-1097(+)